MLSAVCYKAVALLVVHSLFSVAPFVLWESVFGPCFVMQYLMPFLVWLVLQSSWCGRESWLFYSNCLPGVL